MALHIMEEADRCLNCKRPLCQEGCPISTPIPEIIQMFKEREISAAGEKLFENNPMSLVCSIVCDHDAQCEGHCVRGIKSTPVHFSHIEQYISDTYLDRAKIACKPKNGKHVAVVGSGPAGIVAAIKLIQAGCEVTMFDRMSKVGGILQYGIPEFRLSKKIVKRYAALLQKLGVHYRPNTAIGDALYLSDLLKDGYDSIFVATGTWRPKTLGLAGAARGNVLFGLDYLINPNTSSIGEKVAIIGAGNVAMDVARTALRHGAQEVTIYARSKHVSAAQEEVDYALLDGAELVYGKSIQYIEETGPVFKTAIFDDNDTVVGYEDELDHVACDTVIMAVSQGPRNKLVLTTPELESNDAGLLVVDEKWQTSVEGIFAAGDVVLGPKTVVDAAQSAKEAVDSMLSYMGIAQ